MLSNSCVFALLVCAVVANVLEFKKCPESSDNFCEVSEVSIEPDCPIRKNECQLKKGRRWAISANFTSKINSSKWKTGLFGVLSSGDASFADLFEADACQYTSCPIEVNKQQVFTYGLRLSKKLPRGPQTLKWKMWNEDNPSELCCFTSNVNLVR